MIPQPAFRYYSLLHRRQAEAAKVPYKMHANHPPCRSSCYASLTLNSALLPALASGCLLYWTAARNSRAQALFTCGYALFDKIDHKLFRRKEAQISLK